jgi:uncharacterized protein (DUF1330 family)
VTSEPSASNRASRGSKARAPATLEQYGGRFLTRGGAAELIEGGPEPKRVIILEFADKAAVKRRYNSPEYQKILPMRLDNSTGRAFIVEGVS